MSGRSQGSYKWLFTYNNPKVKANTFLKKLKELPYVLYAGFGKEHAPTTGTEHFQGCIEFNVKRSLRWLIGSIGKAIYYKPWRQGTFDWAILYCAKQGDYKETEDRLATCDVGTWQGAVELLTMYGIEKLNADRAEVALAFDRLKSVDQ